MKRRPLVVGGAALAVIAGAGTAWWRTEDDSEPALPPAIDLWKLTFERVDGAPLAMAEWRGRPLLLNFWATWCAPCITEMPLLDRFASARASGWRVLALAIDQADPVRRFIAERKIGLPVALAGSDGFALSRSLGNGQGALPFTAAFDSSGARTQQHLGAVSADLLDRWVAATR